MKLRLEMIWAALTKKHFLFLSFNRLDSENTAQEILAGTNLNKLDKVRLEIEDDVELIIINKK